MIYEPYYECFMNTFMKSFLREMNTMNTFRVKYYLFDIINKNIGKNISSKSSLCSYSPRKYSYNPPLSVHRIIHFLEVKKYRIEEHE